MSIRTSDIPDYTTGIVQSIIGLVEEIPGQPLVLRLLPDDLFQGPPGSPGDPGNDGTPSTVPGPPGPQGNVGPAGPAASPGGSDTQVQFNDATVFAGNANLTFNKTTGVTTAKNILSTPTALVYAGSVALDFNGSSYQTISLTGNITFTTTNLAAGKSISIIITSDASIRTFTFPAWIFVGAAAPASIAASKTAVLSLTATSGADGGVIAAYAAQP